MIDRYTMLKIEAIVNKALYIENVIDKREYERASKRLEKLLFEESKKSSSSPLWLNLSYFNTIKEVLIV